MSHHHHPSKPSVSSLVSHRWRFLSSSSSSTLPKHTLPAIIPLTHEGKLYLQHYQQQLMKDAEIKKQSNDDDDDTPSDNNNNNNNQTSKKSKELPLCFRTLLNMQSSHDRRIAEKDAETEMRIKEKRLEKWRRQQREEEERAAANNFGISIPEAPISPFSSPRDYRPNFIPQAARVDNMPEGAAGAAGTGGQNARQTFIDKVSKDDELNEHKSHFATASHDDAEGRDDELNASRSSSSSRSSSRSSLSSNPSISSRSSTPIILWRASTRVKEAVNLPASLKSVFLDGETHEHDHHSSSQPLDKPALLIADYNLAPRFQSYRTRFKNKARQLHPVQSSFSQTSRDSSSSATSKNNKIKYGAWYLPTSLWIPEVVPRGNALSHTVSNTTRSQPPHHHHKHQPQQQQQQQQQQRDLHAADDEEEDIDVRKRIALVRCKQTEERNRRRRQINKEKIENYERRMRIQREKLAGVLAQGKQQTNTKNHNKKAKPSPFLAQLQRANNKEENHHNNNNVPLYDYNPHLNNNETTTSLLPSSHPHINNTLLNKQIMLKDEIPTLPIAKQYKQYILSLQNARVPAFPHYLNNVEIDDDENSSFSRPHSPSKFESTSTSRRRK